MFDRVEKKNEESEMGEKYRETDRDFGCSVKKKSEGKGNMREKVKEKENMREKDCRGPLFCPF